MHKTCVHQSNNVVFTHPLSTQCLPFTTTLSWLAKLSCLLTDFPVLTQGCVLACVKSFFFGWESYFPDKNMFTSFYWFDSVFWNGFQLSAKPKWVCYIMQHDSWGHAVIAADLHKEISKSWHVNFRWCKILLRQKFQCKFSHYLHLHEYYENEFLDFPSLKNNYLQPLVFR